MGAGIYISPLSPLYLPSLCLAALSPSPSSLSLRMPGVVGGLVVARLGQHGRRESMLSSERGEGTRPSPVFFSSE